MVEIAIKKPLQGSQGAMMLDVNVHISEGSFTVIMGESGSGKTTLLRVLAGLEKADGDIHIEGKSWKSLPPQ